MNNSGKEITARIVTHTILIIFSIICLIPMIITISASLSNETDLARNGISLIPRVFDPSAYTYIFRAPNALINAYGVTVSVTIAGTFLGVLCMSLISYPLSRTDFKWRKVISGIVMFTLLFNGGLVPTYILITKYLHLRNNIFVMFLPIMVNAWNIFLLVAYMKDIPPSIIESAKMDGASEFVIFFRIILPLSKPALATISLLLSLRFWNEWYTALLYITDQNLLPLALWMQRVMRNMQFLLANQDLMGGGAVSLNDLPTESVKMAMAILAAGPMMLVFPFFQKYFAKGLNVGGVKG